ncbi:MAG: phenylalanine--tRNA ligase subunit beta [Euryarchaeota archaeon]|jgi:phenylalanyl-tRNA synthetase beta chain|nr:phenylalanine--tRNA ligase subunit beta [Euryarchaeota archaeon]
MPVINFGYGDLCGLIGRSIPQDVLADRLPMIGADMHDVEDGVDAMSVEFFPDRPDLFSVEGVARAMRAFLDVSPGLPPYAVEDTGIVVDLDPRTASVRPYCLCAVVRGIEMTEELLKSMMELQEKLHITIGRKRSKLAIGIHDLAKVRAPFRYTLSEPHGTRFVPLAKTEAMDLAEILVRHEKGVAYAGLLGSFEEYPVILDADGEVLSFPPVINGALTAVTTGTRDLFIDVTGTDRKAVKGALDIVTTALAERGGTIGAVRMTGAEECMSPDLSPVERRISAAACLEFTGIRSGDRRTVTDALERMGMDAEADPDDPDAVVARYGAYRLDIMHDVDIYEDVAIGHGFERFGGDYSVVQTPGRLSADTVFAESLKDVMIGSGFTEVTTLTLSNEEEEFGISGLPEVDTVRILNPITEEHTCLRPYLMPSLMRILRHNRHRDLPQRIFEVGYVVRDGRNELRLCALATASKTSFTESKSLAESVMREMSAGYTVSPCDHPVFIPGRGAFINVDGERIGFFGEVSPQTVTAFGITHPVTVFEIDLGPMTARRSGSVF